MADNIRRLVAGAVHKAEVGGGGGPGNGVGRVAHVGVLVNKVPSVTGIEVSCCSCHLCGSSTYYFPSATMPETKPWPATRDAEARRPAMEVILDKVMLSYSRR